MARLKGIKDRLEGALAQLEAASVSAPVQSSASASSQGPLASEVANLRQRNVELERVSEMVELRLDAAIASIRGMLDA